MVKGFLEKERAVPFLSPEERELLERGYVLFSKVEVPGASHSTLFHYIRDARPSELDSFLPKGAVEAAYLYLSKFDPTPPEGRYMSFGSYRASLFLRGHSLAKASYSYRFSFMSAFGADYLHYLPAWIVFDVFGNMSGPYPDSAPNGFTFGSRIYVPVFSDSERRTRVDRRVDGSPASNTYSRKLRPPKFEDFSSLLILLYKVLEGLGELGEVSETYMSSEVFLTSSSSIPSNEVSLGDGEGSDEAGDKTVREISRRPHTSYLYIGTVGDLLSGLLGEEEEEEEEEGEEE